MDPLTGCLSESELRPELERSVMKSLLEHSPLALLISMSVSRFLFAKTTSPAFLEI
ncbi:MAG: hypothetical protein WCI95_06170 [bacterium]